MHGETEASFGKISRVYSEKEFRDGLISAVQIATTYRENIDKIERERKMYGAITNEHHFKVTPEEPLLKSKLGNTCANVNTQGKFT